MSGANLLAELGYSDPVAIGAIEGAIEAFGTDRVVVHGSFAPGEALQFRPGRRCVVLTEDAIADFDLSAIGCPECDEHETEAENATDRADVAEHELKKARATINQKNERIEELERALAAAVHQT